MADISSDQELLDALGVKTETKTKKTYTAIEERVIAGFEDIQKFVEGNNRLPCHGEDNDIFERLYAVRLDQIRKKEEYRILLADIDHQDLLMGEYEGVEGLPDDIEDDELLAQLGVDPINDDHSITNLKHVKPRASIEAAEEIARRTPCRDFDKFEPIFVNVQKDMELGIRKTRPFKDEASVEQGNLFILSGQKLYVAEKGEEFFNKNDKKDSRLRVIYDNGAESNILMRSLQRALNKDETGRRILDPVAGPLFADSQSNDDIESGTIYVLRSKSDHEIIKENRDVVHKIGVTGNTIEKRISNAKNDPTFLMDEVEVVASYKLANINRKRLEGVIHKFFSSAKLDIQIKDRFGKPVTAQEWFLVPIFVIDEMVNKIKDGTISDYFYDLNAAKIKKR